jgi:hypothetical protein
LSKAARIKHRIKTVAKEWTAWMEVPVTDEIRGSAPHMEHVAKIYANSRFEVQIYTVNTLVGGVSQVVIARHQHLEEITWNDVMRVKTELFGVGALAIEIYPREVAPMMRIRILWVMPVGYELPCGLDKAGAWGNND